MIFTFELILKSNVSSFNYKHFRENSFITNVWLFACGIVGMIVPHCSVLKMFGEIFACVEGIL